MGQWHVKKELVMNLRFPRNETTTDKEETFYTYMETKIPESLLGLLQAVGYGPEWTCDLMVNGEYRFLLKSHVSGMNCVFFTVSEGLMAFIAVNDEEHTAKGMQLKEWS